MAGIFSFRCAKCGEIHEGSPSFGFRAPSPFLEQTKEIQDAGHLGEDLCWYEDEDGPHYFLRVCLEIPIHGVEEPFLWGVWVSLSKSSFDSYLSGRDSTDQGQSYFGWLCNYLPWYESTYALKTTVHPRSPGIRPCIELEESEHALSVDYHSGISVDKAQAIAQSFLHP